MLPTISYETYSSLELSIFYIFFIVISLNIGFSIYNKLKNLNRLLRQLNPIFALILIITIIINPHLIILNPVGSPTRLDYLETGGFLLISVLAIYLVINLIYIIQERMIKNYIIILAILLIAALTSEFIHESGHAIFALISGGQVTDFRPFPSFINNEINAGYVSYIGVPLSLVPLVTIGSEIFQWIAIIVISLVLYYKKWNYIIKAFLKSLLIISWLDFPLYTINNMLGLPHWFIIGSTHGDILEFTTLTGISIWIMLAISIIQIIIGLIIFIYLGFFKNPFSKKKQQDIK